MVQRDQPKGQSKPESNRADPADRGRNAPAQSTREGETDRAMRERDNARWGSLPDYMELLKTRGGQTEVPEKYRKFRNAFLKQSQENNGKGK